MSTKKEQSIYPVLLSDFPDLFEEADTAKNRDINIWGISAGSNKKIWWTCSKESSHHWQAVVYSRVKGVGCPICSNKLIIAGINDLATVSPSLASEWHPELNGDLTPKHAGAGSHEKVWWKCKANPSHYWQATVKSRTAGTGCGMCRMLVVVHGVNDLSVTNASLYEELHPTLNEIHGIDKDALAVKSNKKVWWKCRIDGSHFWQTSVNDRSRGNSCPKCRADIIVNGINDFSTLHPKLYAEIHPDMNSLNSVDLKVLASSSNQKLWWRCVKDVSHYWRASIVSRVAGSGCSMCSGHYIVHGVNDLSVSNPALYAQIHRTLNETHGIDTMKLSSFTAKKIWWQCQKDSKHYWYASVHHTARDRGCSMCSGKFVVHGINDLSVNYPALYKQLHPSLNTRMNVNTISPGCNQRVWWIDSHGHTWRATPGARVHGSGCPYCANKAVLSGWNDLQTTNPLLAQEWNYVKNASLTPQELTRGSSKSVWWICPAKHEWKATVANRDRGNGCPDCCTIQTSKIQQAFHKELAKLIPDLQCDVRMPVRFRKRASMSVDMVSEALKLVVEYDGYYYHSGGRSGQSMASHMANDTEKTQALVDAGYRVIRIRENGLPHLGMMTDRVLEIDYKYGESMGAVVKTIMDFGDQ